jgi:hypothetical protein
MTSRDPARSYATVVKDDLERLGRCADADLNRFIARNRQHAQIHDRLLVIALAQGGAEHYVRGQRGIWDLDIIVCFEGDPSKQLRRPVVSWDWGESKFGRCPFDPPEYKGRAVDVKYWQMHARPDPIDALQTWLRARAAQHPERSRRLDISHEPIVLIRPEFAELVWDPGPPPPVGTKTDAHRRPVGEAPE